MTATIDREMATTTQPTLETVQAQVRTTWGFDELRPLQRQAIECALSGTDSVVVLPTGGGKSLCYQAPAICLPGVAVVVSPLIALMKDQVDALRENGVAAAFYNSTLSTAERREIVADLRHQRLKLLYIAPESLLSGNMLQLLSEISLSLFAIDEAHCISSWGHDFRPEYRGLKVLKERFPHVGVHAYTATATERVRSDIAEQLELRSPEFVVGNFDRPNLVYRVERRSGGLDQIVRVLKKHPEESGIVYCITRKEVERTAAGLAALGYRAAPYHAGLSDTERHEAQEAFLQETIDVIVATVAFGMGIDKSNVRFVIHAGMPKSLEAYQQESGRAGRDGLEAECWLLYSGGDVVTWKRIIAGSDQASKAALASLQSIEQFCSASRCRHQLLVEHFGQMLDSSDCGACDVCLDQLPVVEDSQIVAQKILSCIVRLEQKFGADYTAQVLTGSRDRKILQRSHDKLSTYALLQEYAKGVVRDWIEQLIAAGFARRVGEYSTLEVTDRGWQVLRGETTPKLLKPAERTSASSAPDTTSWEGVDRELFESLRELRRELAMVQNVAAYVVFSDATLRDMARRRPSTTDGLLAVHGVGQKKCEDYGERFLQRIAEYCAKEGIAQDVAVAPPPKPAPRPKGLSSSAAAAFPFFRQGLSVAEVAERMRRAHSTVGQYLQQYLRHEEITDPSPWVEADEARRIRAAIDEVGGQRLKPIHEHLGGQVSYESIRIVATCLANARGEM